MINFIQLISFKTNFLFIFKISNYLQHWIQDTRKLFLNQIKSELCMKKSYNLTHVLIIKERPLYIY